MKKKKRSILLNIILFIILFFVVVSIIPPKIYIDENPFISNHGPMLASHRGGKILNPENTIKAFDAAINEYHSDILEMDLCLTADEQLVIIHNLYMNNNCDVEELMNVTEKQYINDYTYNELLQFNFGYKFTTVDGNKPYEHLCDGLSDSERRSIIKENNLNIVRIADLFERYYESNPELLYIVEIKNSDELGYKACDILADLLLNTYPNLKHRVVIGTFHTEIEKYLEKTYPELFRGASTGGAASFIITEMLNVNIFDNGSFACLQIPMGYNIKGIKLNLVRHDIVNRAHKRNIAVQYWTINEKEDMEKLIDLGVDAIMTDNPQLLYQVLHERGYK